MCFAKLPLDCLANRSVCSNGQPVPSTLTNLLYLKIYLRINFVNTVQSIHSHSTYSARVASEGASRAVQSIAGAPRVRRAAARTCACGARRAAEQTRADSPLRPRAVPRTGARGPPLALRLLRAHRAAPRRHLRTQRAVQRHRYAAISLLQRGRATARADSANDLREGLCVYYITVSVL